MKATLLGSAEPRIYAVLHEPAGHLVRDFAALLCYPFGQEYMRAHRAIRTLADLLSEAGVATLRFDYSGSGDSGGDEEAFTLEGAERDSRAALEFLRARAAVDTVRVVGLRLGASIAARAFCRTRGVSHLTLWDPVVRGGSYLDFLGSADGLRRERRGDTLWIAGYPLSHRLQEELEPLDLTRLDWRARQRIHLVVSEQPDVSELERSMRAAGARVARQDLGMEAIQDWDLVDEMGRFVLPYDILQAIVTGLLDAEPDRGTDVA